MKTVPSSILAAVVLTTPTWVAALVDEHGNTRRNLRANITDTADDTNSTRSTKSPKSTKSPTSTKSPKSFSTKSSKARDIESKVAKCTKSKDQLEVIDTILEVDEDAFSVNSALFIPVLPNTNLINSANRVLESGLVESFEWLSSGIPPTYNTSNDQNYVGLPPRFIPSAPFANMLPPFLHAREDAPDIGYGKWKAFPPHLFGYLGLVTLCGLNQEKRMKSVQVRIVVLKIKK